MSAPPHVGDAAVPVAGVKPPSITMRFFQSDLWHSFTRSWLTMTAAFITFVMIFSAIFAHQIAPNDPFNLASLSLLDGGKPPFWLADGEWRFPLGTDQRKAPFAIRQPEGRLASIEQAE